MEDVHDVVHPGEVAVLVVVRPPGGAVVDAHASGDGDGLGKVDDPDVDLAAVVDEEEGAADHLVVEEEL